MYFDEAKFCSNLAFIRDGNIIAHNKTEQILKEANTNDIEKAYLYFISKTDGTMEATK
jgi:ABC-type Na+ transport system ATPase subunit NatA